MLRQEIFELTDVLLGPPSWSRLCREDTGVREDFSPAQGLGAHTEVGLQFCGHVLPAFLQRRAGVSWSC